MLMVAYEQGILWRSKIVKNAHTQGETETSSRITQSPEEIRLVRIYTTFQKMYHVSERSL